MSHIAEPYDLLVIGGGVNGASIARAAAIAGKSVLLVEQGDLAQATSSASTKLMHGGLRYLEHYEFKLVREALAERAIMLRCAPHIVRPLEFLLPHAPSMRPWPVVRLGLWIYDLLASGGSLPRSRSVTIDDPALTRAGKRGFSYWDGRVDDSRLVVLNALDAAENGADIRTRTPLLSAERGKTLWRATVGDGDTVHARVLINAAGPWVEQVLRGTLGISGGSHARLVRGSHIVVRRCLDGDHAWLFQQPDGRIVFAIPWLDDFTLIGTTDFAVSTVAEDTIAPAEIDYLLAAANLYLRKPINQTDVIGHFAGIRPLVDDGADAASAVTRDYRLELDREAAPVLSVFGGKVTTARHLAEVAMKRLGITGGDTRTRPLPGGDLASFPAFLAEVRRRWPVVAERDAERMARAYGTRVADVLGESGELGRHFGAGLHAREVDYLMRTEWARTADDILWRRTKLGYHYNKLETEELDRYIREFQG